MVSARDTKAEILREFNELSSQNEQLAESLDRSMAMLKQEDIGWLLKTGGSLRDAGGPTLDQLNRFSDLATEMAVANPLIKRGVLLRHSYVWSKPPVIPNLDQSPGKRGPKSNTSKFFTNPVNQSSVFADDAHLRMETAVATEGCFLLVGDNLTKEMRPIPLKEIQGVITHPDFPSEIWAYVRQWSSVNAEGKTETKRRIYYVDTYSGERKTSMKIGRETVEVSQDTILDFWAQRQVGWTFGVPDTLSAIPWTQGYTELMQQGRIMTDALARFAAKVTTKTQKGADKVGVKVSGGRGAGQMATIGEGNDLDIFQSAGKTYDFGGLRPWAAMVATSLEVSIVHLLSDPGAAGNSYGSASNLDLPTKRAMVSRQNAWASFLERVVKWGTGEEVNVQFPTLDEPDPYREAQTVVLGWNSGLFHEKEIRDRLGVIANIQMTEESFPEGVLLPNNAKSLNRRDIDADGAGGDSGDEAGQTSSTASPDQGRSNGSGGTSSGAANDLRSDKIGEMLSMMRVEELIEKVERATEALERATRDTTR